MAANKATETRASAELVKELSAVRFLTIATAEELLPYLEILEIDCGKTLWEAGQASDFAAIILSGLVEEKKATEFADKQFVVGVYGKGAMIGESSLQDDFPRPLTAVCLEDTRLLTFPRARFANLQQENPYLAMQLLKLSTFTLSIRLNKAFDRLAAIF